MTTLPVAVTVLGWLSSAGLALVLARGRRAAVARGEHLARVAHELRGPLHAAGLVLHSVRRHTQDDAAIRALAALEVELGRVALATGDLHGDRPARRPPTGQAPPACDVAALVDALAPGWRTQAEAAGRSLQVSVPHAALWASGARLRLAQALGNLVANALEHGAGDVTVTVRPASGGQVHVEVCDDGAGLPASVATLVMRPRDTAGPRGHGLAIAAGIAADAGGRLSAAPAGRGARLFLRLPAADAEPAAVDRSAPGHPTRPLAS